MTAAPPIHRLAVAAVATALVATGCAGLRGERRLTDSEGRVWDSFGDASVVAEPEIRVDPARIAVAADAAVPAAFAFTATTITGDPTTGGELLGDRGTIVMFLQPSCPVSVDEAPRLAAAARRHPDLRFVVAFSGGRRDQYGEMIEAAGLDLPNIAALDDTSLALWNRFAIVASPSSLLVDGDLRVRSSYGALGDDGLDRAARAVADGFAVRVEAEGATLPT